MSVALRMKLKDGKDEMNGRKEDEDEEDVPMEKDGGGIGVLDVLFRNGRSVTFSKGSEVVDEEDPIFCEGREVVDEDEDPEVMVAVELLLFLL